MEENKIKVKGSLQKKIAVRLMIIVVGTILLMNILNTLQTLNMRRQSAELERNQQTSIRMHSRKSVMDMIYWALMENVEAQALNLNSEFTTLSYGYKILAKQVQDVFKNPDNYAEITVNEPSIENKGKYTLQLTYAENAGKEDEEALKMIRKLANLGPAMQELIVGNNEFTAEVLIALPNGMTLFMDDKPDMKFDRDKQIRLFDPRERDWYRGAVKTGDTYFTKAMRSIDGPIEVMLGLPVYEDGQLVAVLEGAVRMDKIQKKISDYNYLESGFAVIVSKDGNIIYSPRREGDLALDKDLKTNIRKSPNEDLREVMEDTLKTNSGVWELTVDNEVYLTAFAGLEALDWTYMVFIKTDDASKSTEALLNDISAISQEAQDQNEWYLIRAMIVRFAVVIVIVIIALHVAKAVARKIARPVKDMTKEIDDIEGDNFIFEMKDSYRTDDEIEVLAAAFENLSEKMRNYINEITAITAEKERIGAELNVATKIQADMLPSVFPLFPKKKEFDVYASMNPAKEVGGDFYDLFLIDSDHLCLVMGDVSGKGVPAALFMVISKTMIKNRAQMGDSSPSEILFDVNNSLVEGNNEKMFVTVWIGILTISTGELIESNAGHEHPVIKKMNEEYKLVRTKHGVAMGVMSNMTYKEDRMILEAGDFFFMYTDGVPEATNSENVLFGKERMVEALNRHIEDGPEALLKHMRKEVDDFVGDAPQFDDLTMLAVEYKGPVVEK